MKKIFASFITLFFLTGCSLMPGQSEEGSTSATSPQKTPSQFETLASKARDIWAKKIIEFVPSTSLAPDKNEITFDFLVDFTTATLGNININLKTKSKSDLSKVDEISSQAELEFLAKLTSDGSALSLVPSGEIAGKIASKMLNQKIFYALQEFNLNVPNIPAEMVTSLIDPFVGVDKWVGGNFTDLEKILQEKGLPYNVDIAKFMSTKAYSPTNLLDIKMPLQTALMEAGCWKNKGNATSDLPDMASFNVEIDKEKATQTLVTFIKTINELVAQKVTMTPEIQKGMNEETEKAKEKISNFFAENNVIGKLSINKNNPEYFTFDGKVKNNIGETPVKVFWLENKKELLIQDELNDEDIKISIEGNEILLTSNQKEIMTIKNSSEKFEVNVFDFKGDGSNVFKVDLNKNGEVLSGGIIVNSKVGDVKNLIINVNELFFSKENLKIDISINADEGKEITFKINSQIKELDEVIIEEPTEFESFADFLGKVENTLNSMMGGGMDLYDQNETKMEIEEGDDNLKLME